MSNITRYDIERVDYEEFEMVELDYGDYVKFDDYDNLCREFDDLKEKYDRLVGKIGEIYREG